PEQVVASVMTKLKKRGKGIVLLHDFQYPTSLALPELLAQLKAGGYKIVLAKSKDPVKTLPEYDEAINKEFGGGTVSSRPTSSVWRTISECVPVVIPKIWLGRPFSFVQQVHRGRRAADRPHAERCRTSRCHKSALGSSRARRLGSRHADAATRPPAKFLAARSARTAEPYAPYCPPAKAADPACKSTRARCLVEMGLNQAARRTQSSNYLRACAPRRLAILSISALRLSRPRDAQHPNDLRS